jgi:hypothetical protein
VLGTRALAVGSEPHAADAATAALAKGNAVDAVAAGVFAAAAVARGVLLGPVQLVVGGAGAGLRAVDGRTHQPGRGLPRPRGFRPGDAIPDAARVAVPAMPAALAAALGSFGRGSLARALGPAIELARPLSAARAGVLTRIARRGPLLADAPIGGELVEAAGRLVGGILGTRDLAELRPTVRACRLEGEGSLQIATVPWGAAAVRDAGAEPLPAAWVHVVAAMDARGLVAIAIYESPDDGVAVPALDLLLPFAAEPVLRGQPRVRPGEPRPASAPFAMALWGGIIELAVALVGAKAGERVLRAWLADQATPPKAGRAVGVMRTEGGARPLGAPSARPSA